MTLLSRTPFCARKLSELQYCARSILIGSAPPQFKFALPAPSSAPWRGYQHDDPPAAARAGRTPLKERG